MKQRQAFLEAVKKGDILVAMDDQKIKTIQDIKIAMLDKKRGDTVKIRVRRHRFLFGDQEIDLNLVL